MAGFDFGDAMETAEGNLSFGLSAIFPINFDVKEAALVFNRYMKIDSAGDRLRQRKAEAHGSLSREAAHLWIVRAFVDLCNRFPKRRGWLVSFRAWRRAYDRKYPNNPTELRRVRGLYIGRHRSRQKA